VPKTTASQPAAGFVASTVPDLTLTDATKTKVKLRENLPAVVLLVDGCACDGLITSTAEAVPTTVTVLAVARVVPTLPAALPAGKRVKALADESGALRTAYAGASPGGGVIAVLVNPSGKVIHAISGVTKVDDFRADLSSLT
jgi:hypothetical protein